MANNALLRQGKLERVLNVLDAYTRVEVYYLDTKERPAYLVMAGKVMDVLNRETNKYADCEVYEIDFYLNATRINIRREK